VTSVLDVLKLYAIWVELGLSLAVAATLLVAALKRKMSPLQFVFVVLVWSAELTIALGQASDVPAIARVFGEPVLTIAMLGACLICLVCFAYLVPNLRRRSGRDSEGRQG
jgi:hypothetical protein